MMKLKNGILFLLLITASGIVCAQTTSDLKLIKEKSDSLKLFAYSMVNDLDAGNRYQACMEFIPHLVETLKVPFSFNYQFDSLKEVSILYPPDSSFRIFTWAITPNDKMSYRFYGALQMKTHDGSLKLFPFFDNSEFTHDFDTITSNRAWIGALYYNMIATKSKGKTFYTLFGWHGYQFRSDEKLLDVLTFKDGKPVFGAPIFNLGNGSNDQEGIKNRFFLIYKRNGGLGLNYDPDRKMIIFDHLTSLTGKPQEKYTLVPDGTYEGFRWSNGHWMHVSRIFHNVSKKPPFPAPVNFGKSILDKEGLNKEGH